MGTFGATTPPHNFLSAKLFVKNLFKVKKSETCNFIKRETLAQVFSSEFCETSRNTFFTEHLWMTASVF